MSHATGIMLNDLARMARDGAPQLVGRRITDPVALSEAEFILQNGMTREAAAERARIRERQDWEAQCVSDLNGDPPTDLCTTRGLSPKRTQQPLRAL